VGKKVIAVVGPTASGKSALGLNLAKKLNGEIISADSRQIFKGMNIGTATPTEEELKEIPHHFINEFYPEQEFNVSKFETSALKLIQEIFNRGKKPVVVGGSGLYVRALIDGIMDVVDTDKEYRARLHSTKKEKGNEELYRMLEKTDPAAAETMLPQNWKRVMRALEVFHLSGKSILQLQKEYKRETKFDFIQIGLDWERAVLYQRIEKRIDEMINAGLVDEVKFLLNAGYSKDLNALNTVGYKEIISFLEGEYDLERAIELIKRNTRRFAKRQLTWFRRDERINWYEIKNAIELNGIADDIINRFSF